MQLPGIFDFQLGIAKISSCRCMDTRGFTKFGVKATVSGVVEDLKFKISESSDPNWCFPDSAQLAVSV